MTTLIHEHHNFGNPYKLFKDLKDDDYIYLIDFKDFKIVPIQVYSIKVTDISDYWSTDRYKVTFDTSDIKLCHEPTIWDGNTFITEIYDGQKTLFFTTDERIGKSILDIIRQRNNYQWETFTHLFGTQLNRYADKEIKLGYKWLQSKTESTD